MIRTSIWTALVFATVAGVCRTSAADTGAPGLTLEPTNTAPFRFKAPKGWRLCPEQQDDVRVTPDGIDAPPLEAERDLRAYVVYLNVQRSDSSDQPKGCRSLAFVVQRPSTGGAKPEAALPSEYFSQDVAAASAADFMLGGHLESERSHLYYRIPAGTTKLSLPENVYHCTGTSPSRDLDIPAGATEITTTTTSDPSCTSASSNTRIALAIPSVPADVAAVALDWTPSAPSKLDVYISSATLAADPGAQAAVAVQLDGVPAQWVVGSCANQVCKATASVGNARAKQKVMVKLLPTVVAAGTAFNANGKPILSTEFSPSALAAWLTDPTSLAADQQLSLADVDGDGPKAFIDRPIARFLNTTSVRCTTPANVGCPAIVDTPSSGSSQAILYLQLMGPKDPTRKVLRQGTVLTYALAFGPSITLVKRADFQPLPASTTFALTVRQVTCKFVLTQLTRVYGGLAGGSVYYAVDATGDPKCSPSGWTVTASDPDVKLAPAIVPDREGSKLFHIDIVSLPNLDSPSTPTLSFKRDDVDVDLDSGGTMTIEPAPRFDYPDVRVDALPVAQAAAAGPVLAAETPDAAGKRIAIARASWISFRVARPELWKIELDSPEVRPCHELVPAGQKPRVSFREQALCVIGLTAAASVQLKATMQGPIERLLLPGAERLGKLDGRTGMISLGSRSVAVAFAVAPYRLAYSLTEHGRLVCSDGTAVRSGEPTRAVDLGGGQCTFRLDLGPVPAAAVAVAPKPHIEALLGYYGRQRIKLQAATKGGTALTVDGSPTTVSLGDGGVLRSPWREVTDEHGTPVGIEVPVEAIRRNAASVAEYDEITVTISQTDSTDYVTDDPASDPSTFVGTIRKMPSNGFLGLSHKYITSQGEAHWLRGFFTFAVPVGMFRYPNSGLGANSSGDYERLEQPSFQAGLIYSLQCWRFDSNEPCWSFTPQLQAGILLSPWRDGLQVPRPSGILGVALRLPGGTKPTSALEASAGAIIWGEVTEGARGGVWASVLFGLAVNLGALGN